MSSPRTGATPLRAVASAAGLIALVTVLARAAGFLRTLAFSAGVGATGVGAAYQSANTLPNVVYEVAAGGVLAAVAVPVVAGRLGAGDPEAADRAASAMLTWAVVVLTPLAAGLALFAPALSRALIGGPQAATDLGAELIVLFAPQVPLYGVGIVLAGVLQAHRRFLGAALAPLLSSLVVIATYLGYGAMTDPGTAAGDAPRGAVLLLGLGTTAGVVVLSLPLAVPARRAGIRLRPRLTFPPGTGRRAGALAAAGALALLGQQVAVLTTIWLSNRSGDAGTLNVYQYVQAVYLLPYAVLAVPVATSALPALAHDTAGGHDAAPVLAGSARAVLLLTGGAAAVLLAVAGPVGQFFTALDRGGGGAGRAALAALPETMLAYAPGLVGFGLAALLTRALYVRGRPVHAAGAVAAGWLVAALLPLALVPPGVGAGTTLRLLGIGSSVGMTLTAVLLAVLVHRSWGPEVLAGTGRTLRGVVVGVAVGLAAGDLLLLALDPHGMAGAVGAGAATGTVVGACYLATLAVLDRPTLRAALEHARARRPRGARPREGER